MQVGAQHAGQRIGAVGVAEVVVPVPAHVVGAEEHAGGVLGERGGVAGDVGHRAHRDVQTDARRPGVAVHEGRGDGQVAAGAGADDAERPTTGEVLVRPGNGVDRIVERQRVAVLGRQSVVHRAHPHAERGGEPSAQPVGHVQVAVHPTTAVEEHEHRRGGIVAVDPQGERRAVVTHHVRIAHRHRRRGRVRPPRGQVLGARLDGAQRGPRVLGCAGHAQERSDVVGQRLAHVVIVAARRGRLRRARRGRRRRSGRRSRRRGSSW